MTLLMAVTEDAQLGFPRWLSVTHFLNFLFIGLLIRSGWEIIATHPRFYWRNDCGPGTEWIRFTKREVPPEEGAYTARDDEISLSPLIALPGRKKAGLGRHWHSVVTALWVLNGLIYVVLLFGTGAWRWLIPTSWGVFGDAWDSLVTYATLSIPSIEHFNPYDSLQQLMYSVVVFVAAPLMILTGPAMSPAVAGRFPWYPRLFGGRQAARSLHFLGMAFYLLFAVIHIALVFIVYVDHNLPRMMLGVGGTDRFGEALILTLIGIALAVGIWLWASWWSHRDPRRAQVILNRLAEPLRKVFLNPLKSRQRGAYTEANISPYHWTNGRYPTPEESPE